eukprot:CAMPEP_0178376808 /NCGR_PEP_ID=MMETSP0689_2-20121128/3594_1 /TAXON_ID=160604 /ORGANISM="Amphidinium massartii, Strain CS-259" /LENGTH=254 /DNA_ID=CAMNT_0019996843 /DNA_START=56 /DNA_END=817 /DNA_ORIENTATION=-
MGQSISLAAAREKHRRCCHGQCCSEISEEAVQSRAAPTSKGLALGQASEVEKAEKSLVMRAVSQDGLALRHAAASLQADKEVVLAALVHDAYALEYASKGLRSDRDVVMTAVERRGRTLRFAAPSLQADKDVVATAVKQDGSAILFASEELRSDVDFLTEMLQQSRRPAFPCIHCFHVSLLSGRCCCFLLPEASTCYRMRTEVLRKCAHEFDLHLDTVLRSGYLLDKTTTHLLEDDEDLLELDCWTMHELSLVV